LLKKISLLGRQQERSLELQHENIEDEKIIKFQQQGFAHKYEALVGQNQQLFEENKNLGHELDVENATLRNVSEQKRLLFAELKRVRLSKGSKLDAEHKERLREKARNAALEDQVQKLEGRASAAEARSRDLRRRAESAELRAKRTSGTRPVLAAAVFNALDENGDKRVTTPELRILAQALGFKGEQHEWEEQYKELLRDHHMDPEKGVQKATFMELVNDEADPRLHCTDEELVVLLGKLSVAAVRPEVLALLPQKTTSGTVAATRRWGRGKQRGLITGTVRRPSAAALETGSMSGLAVQEDMEDIEVQAAMLS